MLPRADWCQAGFVVVPSNEVPVTRWHFVINNPWDARRR